MQRAAVGSELGQADRAWGLARGGSSSRRLRPDEAEGTLIAPSLQGVADSLVVSSDRWRPSEREGGVLADEVGRWWRRGDLGEHASCPRLASRGWRLRSQARSRAAARCRPFGRSSRHAIRAGEKSSQSAWSEAGARARASARARTSRGRAMFEWRSLPFALYENRQVRDRSAGRAQDGCQAERERTAETLSASSAADPGSTSEAPSVASRRAPRLAAARDFSVPILPKRNCLLRPWRAS